VVQAHAGGGSFRECAILLNNLFLFLADCLCLLALTVVSPSLVESLVGLLRLHLIAPVDWLQSLNQLVAEVFWLQSWSGVIKCSMVDSKHLVRILTLKLGIEVSKLLLRSIV